MCAAPKSRIVGETTPEEKLLKIVHCCPKTPMSTNNLQSTVLAMHDDNMQDSTCTNIPLAHEHRYFSKQKGEVELPRVEDDTLLVGCKKANNINRFYDRTAGLLAVV